MESESLKIAKPFLGKKVTVIMDRPLGSKHPKHGFLYEANYDYIDGVMSPDGEQLDAYYLGTDQPLEKAEGEVVAIIHRTDNDDDKLVVVPDGIILSDEEILRQVNFQEQWFKSIVIRK